MRMALRQAHRAFRLAEHCSRSCATQIVSRLCTSSTTISSSSAATMDLRESTSKQNDVALRLLKHVVASADNKTSNLVFSPPSINIVLSMIAAGSVGSTKDQILSVLGSQSTDHLNSFFSKIVSVVFADGSRSGGPRLSAANGVWIDKSLSFKPSFKQLLENYYKAASNQIDFQKKANEATAEVNSWVEKQTNGLIKKILSDGSVNNLTRLIFANALYFKGAWKEEFDALFTNHDDFHLLDGTSVLVPFMTSMDKQYVNAYDGFKVLRLPYQRGHDWQRRFSMYFYLSDVKDGLPALVDKIISSSGFIDSHIPYKRVELEEFRIPKFKISFGFEASEIMKSLGMTSLFCHGDLTEIVNSSFVGDELFLSSFFHKSSIQVNENGTEAAATLVAGIQLKSCLVTEKKIDFVADHPFLFLIREDVTGLVLMMGQVLNPLRIE